MHNGAWMVENLDVVGIGSRRAIGLEYWLAKPLGDDGSR
jgi:hypothetical protein